jgi:nucleoside diphosphate kinase
VEVDGFRMALKEIIQEIEKLSTADQYRLKEYFAKSLVSYAASEPVFKEVAEQKHNE